METEGVRCRSCGAMEGFYRNVEVSGTGWSNAEIVGHDDGSIAFTVDSSVEEIDWDTHFTTPNSWGCSQCGAETFALDELVEVALDVDPIKRAQKHPMPGQMTFS